MADFPFHLRYAEIFLSRFGATTESKIDIKKWNKTIKRGKNLLSHRRIEIYIIKNDVNLAAMTREYTIL